VHNRANAFKARRRLQRGGVTTVEDADAGAPVSMARATLEHHLSEFPDKLADLRGYLDAVLAAIKAAGDVEAAGAEVEDAHRDALAKITEAERRAAAAERATRLAEDRASTAEREREEADAVAEEAIADAARTREQSQAEIAQIRADAEASIALANERLAAAEREHQDRLAERDAEVEQAHREVSAAQVDAASARAAERAAGEEAQRERSMTARLREELGQARSDAEDTRQRLQTEIDAVRLAGQRAADETAAVRADLAAARAELAAAQRAVEAEREARVSLGGELERQRQEARTERDTLRTAHAEQIAQVQRSADERVHALTEALAVAREAADTYRAQIPAGGSAVPARKRTPRTPGQEKGGDR
jgi:chromosome segregation ATPase